jgi:hypothetical protein
MVLAAANQIVKDPSKLKDLFGSTPTLIGDIVVDVLLGENQILSWDLTKHPVEAGLDVTDSRYQKPVGVTLDCIFCDPDFSLGGLAGGLADAIVSKGPLSDANPFSKATWQEKRDALRDLQTGNRFIDVTTPNNEYDSMMIKDVRPIFDKDKADAYFFRIDLERVETVSSDVVAIDDSQIPEDLKAKKDATAAAKTGKKKPKGKQTPKDASKKKSSILNNLVGKYL